MSFDIDVLQLFRDHPVGTTVLLAIVIIGVLVYRFLRILLDENQADAARASIFKWAFKLTGKADKEKKYIASDIRARLNSARNTLHFGTDILPKAIDVEWVETGGSTAYTIADGDFVVRLDTSASQIKNICTLAQIHVHSTTLTGLRHAVDEPLQVAIDTNLVRNLLTQLGDRRVLDWFLANEYGPKTNITPQVKHRNDQVVLMDQRGLFTRILLVELGELARRVYGSPPLHWHNQEVLQFVEFLYTIVSRKSGQNVPLVFKSGNIQVGIIIVAKTAKILHDGTAPYLMAMHYKLNAGCKTVYVLMADKEWLGEYNTTALDEFEGKLDQLKQEILKETTAHEDQTLDFDFIDAQGRKRKGRLIRYSSP